MDSKQIKDYQNIIFDLGGVILNIDYQRAVNAFQKLGHKDFDASYSQLVQTHFFDRYERGEITSAEFRDGLREGFDIQISDTEIDAAWNAMLLDLPQERLTLLQKLGATKRLTLLSNTNEIHIKEFSRSLKEEHGISDLSVYFEKLHYSYEVGMRKPEARIFEYVLNHHGFKTEETLFIDDSVQHIEGAKKVGLNAYLLKANEGETILDLFGHIS